MSRSCGFDTNGDEVGTLKTNLPPSEDSKNSRLQRFFRDSSNCRSEKFESCEKHQSWP